MLTFSKQGNCIHGVVNATGSCREIMHDCAVDMKTHVNCVPVYAQTFYPLF